MLKESSLSALSGTLFSELLTELIFTVLSAWNLGDHAKHILSTSPQFLHWWALYSDLSKFNQTGISSVKADNTASIGTDNVLWF